MQPRMKTGGWFGHAAIALALLLLTSLAGCAQRPAQFPTGTYKTTITDTDIANHPELGSYRGDWITTYNGDGTFHSYHLDVEIDYGKYTIAGDQITMVDEGGSYAVVGDEASATYRWSTAKDGALSFTTIDDKVAPRKLINEAHPWAKTQ